MILSERTLTLLPLAPAEQRFGYCGKKAGWRILLAAFSGVVFVAEAAGHPRRQIAADRSVQGEPGSILVMS